MSVDSDIAICVEGLEKRENISNTRTPASYRKQWIKHKIGQSICTPLDRFFLFIQINARTNYKMQGHMTEP